MVIGDLFPYLLCKLHLVFPLGKDCSPMVPDMLCIQVQSLQTDYPLVPSDMKDFSLGPQRQPLPDSASY